MAWEKRIPSSNHWIIIYEDYLISRFTLNDTGSFHPSRLRSILSRFSRFWDINATDGIHRPDGEFFRTPLFRITHTSPEGITAQWTQPLTISSHTPTGVLIVPTITLENSLGLIISLRSEPGIPHKVWAPGFQTSYANTKGKEQVTSFFDTTWEELIQGLSPLYADGDRNFEKVNMIGTRAVSSEKIDSLTNEQVITTLPEIKAAYRTNPTIFNQYLMSLFGHISLL